MASATGADAVAVRLVDRAGRFLHLAARTGPGQADERVSVRGAIGSCLDEAQVRRDGERVHVPLAVRGITHGVLTLHGTDAAGDGALAEAGELSALLIAQAGQVTDAYEVRRRSASFAVSAELQWQVLPPTTVRTGHLDLHALIEPAPRVSSDLFDWSVDGERLWLAVLDARGRNLSAALPGALAVAALRHARRAGSPLADQLSLADETVYDQGRGRDVVRAAVLVVDPHAGTVRALRAGDDDAAPRLFRRRRGAVVELTLADHEELGRFERSRYRDEPRDLGPGDDLLVVTDGGPRALDASGRSFGMDRVVDAFAGAGTSAGLPRRLLDAQREHSGGELTQDATAVVVRWRA